MAAYVPDSHKAGVNHSEDDSHAAKVAAMFGGSGLHAGQKVEPVRRNFVIPRKKSQVELVEVAENREPAPPPPPTNQYRDQVVTESLAGVSGWAAKFGTGRPKEAPMPVRRRASLDLNGAVSSGKGVERNMPKSPSKDAPPAKIFDPSTGKVVVSPARPITVVAGRASQSKVITGNNRTISFTSDGMLNHSDDESDAAPTVRPHPRISAEKIEHKAPIAVVVKKAAQPQKYGGGVIGRSNIATTPKPTSNIGRTPTKSAVKFGMSSGPKCPVCAKSVFKMEEVLIEGVHFHKWCCRCSVDTCNKRLTAGNYASYKGAFYCKPCFMKAFKQKGNYDEGFGHAQRKLDWTSPEKVVSLGAETDM